MRGWRGATASGSAGLAAWLLLAVARLAGAYDLDVNSTDSIKSIAGDMCDDMMSWYVGNEPGNTPGLLPAPYYWWEAGAMMGSLVDYWYYTGDTKYNNITQQGLLFQVGPNKDYMPPNQTMDEGNDDQGFWGLAAMSAAEYNFANPPDGQPGWLALAQAVFNTQAARWDTANCGGGLRWQIFTWNNGYNYKNSISQACFFNLAARLALYTGNQSYADWANKTWDWMVASKFMDSSSYYIYDGAHIENCSYVVPYQWTYNAGAFLLGAAAMYNYTNGTSAQDTWRTRVDGMLNGTQVFFTGNKSNIMTEVACEPVNLCDVDQLSFKAYLSRWMAATTKWAPWTYDRVLSLLQPSAVAAASQCTGGNNGRMCGLKWTDNGKWDGTSGVGQQMAAMEVVLGTMIAYTYAPLTNSTGGTSQGDPGAGGSDVGQTDPFSILNIFPPVQTADRVGAYICTVVAVVALLAGVIFVIMDETSDETVLQRLAAMRSAVLGGAGTAVLLKRRRASRAEKAKSFDPTDSDRGSSLPDTTGVAGALRALTQNTPPYEDAFIAGQWRRSGSDLNNDAEGYMTAREARLSHPSVRSSAGTGVKRSSLKKKPVPGVVYP